MPALARCFGEMQLRMLAAVVLELELRDVLERALLAGAKILAGHHLLVRLGRVLDAGETEPLVQIPAILRQRARGGMPVPERPLQLVVALTRPVADLADEVTGLVVAEDVREARREIVHLRERSVQLVARSDHFVERMLRLRGLAAHPDAALDAPARRLLQRADRLARARIRHRLLQRTQRSRQLVRPEQLTFRLREVLAVKQLLRRGEPLQLLERVEGAGVERV